MRSVQVTKPSGPFEIVERDIPEPGAGKVRINVQACGICHGDSATKEGLFPAIFTAEGFGRLSPSGSVK
jgi:D-arabinose 1-dehydrogenase-like Zn-dependent alcohol dehydrogenase